MFCKPTPPWPPGKTAKKACRNEVSGLAADWNRQLPKEFRDLVEAPLYFETYSEYEIDATRVVGFDADAQPCFTAHRVELTELVSDDDETFYEMVLYSEEMAAWRLRDERWLIYRRISSPDSQTARGFYSLGPDMPR
jgi:hypothetical protein